MKIKFEKNKIVFAIVLATLLIFLISYSVMVMGDNESNDENLKQTLVPELDKVQKEYDSKLDAINDLKEVRETNAPSIYDEKLLDSTGLYNPDLPELEKQRIVDSIYNSNRVTYSDRTSRKVGTKWGALKSEQKIDSAEIIAEQKLKAKELGIEHQLFFASDPKHNQSSGLGATDAVIYAVVNGNQTVMVNSRLRMRLIQDAIINGKRIPKNTDVFGFISFQPNRALIEIENIDHHPTKLKAFDFQDGSVGIYVQNSFRAEATGEVLDDIIQDINVPGVPQVGGVSKVLRRRNRNVKVTVLNNYKLILKADNRR